MRRGQPLAPGNGPFVRRHRRGIEGIGEARDHQVVEALAHQLPDLLAERDWPHADAILSGLPFAVWEPERQDAVLDAVLATLKPGGRFVTFTYAHTAMLSKARRFRSVLLERFQTVTISPVVWKNTPPAMVYRCQR